MPSTIERRCGEPAAVWPERRVTSPMPASYARVTGPARAYLLVMAARYGVVGYIALFADPRLVATPTLQRPVPVGVWGTAFCLMALATALGAALGRERLFRHLILVSFFLTAATAARLGVGLAEGDLRFVMAPVFAGALALKDMVVSAMQVTAPLAELLPEVGDGHE